MIRSLRLAAALALALPALAGCVTSTHLSRAEHARIAGRTYVIVGASSGFGRGAAVRLGLHRANVVLAARRTELLEQVAAEIRAAGGQALVVPTDAGNPEQVAALANAATSRFGRIDVWMNIAGVGAVGRFWDIPVADHARLTDTNLKGVIYGSHAALNHFLRQGSGVLVNMGSVESQVPLAYHASYSATKAAVLSLGRAINQEIRHAGYARTIKVATVMPWAADTPFFNQTANYAGQADRMILLDPPEKIVDMLVRASIRPKEEMPVGWKAAMADNAHHLFPDMTETIAANIHRTQIAKGTPLAPTSGNVHQPVRGPSASGVDGGVRARMKAEDARAKQRDE